MNAGGWLAAAAVLGVLLCACTLTPATSPTPAPSPTPPSPSPPATVAAPAPQRTVEALPDSEGEATMLVHDPSMVFSRDEEGTRGPESFWVDGDLITILDHLNDRVVSFRDGAVAETLEWPATADGDPVPGVDLAIDGDTFYFLAFGEPFVHVHQRLEGGLAPVRVIDFSSVSSVQTDRIELQDDQLIGVTYSGRRFLIEGDGTLPPDPFLDLDEQLPSHVVVDGQLNVRLLSRHDPVGINLLRRDATGSWYSTAESFYSPDAGNVYLRHVYQFAADGSLLRTFSPHRGVDHVPNREFRVVADKLYQLLDRNDGARVLQVHPNPA